MKSRILLGLLVGLVAFCAPGAPIAHAAPAVPTTTAQLRAGGVAVTPVAYGRYYGYGARRPFYGYGYRGYFPYYGYGYGYTRPYYSFRPRYGYGFGYLYPQYVPPYYFGFRYPGAGYRAYSGPGYYGYRW